MTVSKISEALCKISDRHIEEVMSFRESRRRGGRKKAMLSLLIAAALVALCAVYAYGDGNGIGSCAFIRSIDGDTVTLDFADYISSNDRGRMVELGLSDPDLPNGYYIHNPERDTVRYRLTDQTVFNFIDWGNDFVGEGEDRYYTTTNVEDFIRYIGTYNGMTPKMPFFVEVEGEVVVSITEKIMM